MIRMIVASRLFFLGVALLTSAAMLLTPVRGTAQSVPSGTDANVSRRLLAKQWLPVWRQGGHEADTLFGFVREHVVLHDRIHVVDAGTLQLHTFNANTGAHVWSAGSKGRGPAQMLRPVDLAVGPANSIYVLDPDNSRISRFTDNGQMLPPITNKWLALGQALCVMDDGGIIVHLSSSYAYLLEIDAAGREKKGWAFPWTGVDKNNTFLTGAGSLRGKPTDSCVFYTTFGFGLVFINKDRTLHTVPYVERVAPPTFVQRKMPSGVIATLIDKGENAGLGGSVWGDTIALHFMSAGKRTVLDLYSRRGVYLATMPTPPEDRLIYANRRVYGLSSDDATQKLRVWVDAADTARVLAEMGLRQPRRPTPKRVPRAGTTARRTPPAPVPPPAHR